MLEKLYSDIENGLYILDFPPLSMVIPAVKNDEPSDVIRSHTDLIVPNNLTFILEYPSVLIPLSQITLIITLLELKV